MDEANFMQTVCWQTRPLAISNQARARKETFNRYLCSRSRQMQSCQLAQMRIYAKLGIVAPKVQQINQ